MASWKTLLALLVALSLAGCFGGDGDEAGPDPGPDDENDTPPPPPPDEDGDDNMTEEPPTPPPGPETTEGSSRLMFVGVCNDGDCQGQTTRDDGTFTVPASRSVRLEATWESEVPTASSLRIRVMMGEEEIASGEGASPLSITIGDLAAGTYSVAVDPTGAGGHVDVTVAWTVTYTPAPPPAEEPADAMAEA